MNSEERKAHRAAYEARRKLLREGVKSYKLQLYLNRMCSRVIRAEHRFDLLRWLEIDEECRKWQRLAKQTRETSSPLAPPPEGV